MGGGLPSSLVARAIRSSTSRYSTSRSSPKTLEGVGVRVRYTFGCGRHPVAVTPKSDVVPHGPACGLLHRDALGLGALPKSRLLVLGKTQSHCHAAMVSD